MSIRAVLSCNGNEGAYPCHQATPVGEVANARDARHIANKLHGWTYEVVSFVGGPYLVYDFCKQCTKRKAEGRS